MHRKIAEQRGIVLRRYLDSGKLVIFDQKLGTCVVLAQKEGALSMPLLAGCLIGYQLRELRRYHQLQAVVIQDLPFALARHDIYFLHRVLELCYFSLPPGMPSPQLFVLLLCLYGQHSTLHKREGQLLFLAQFFAILGMIPEEVLAEYQQVHELISRPVESMLEENLESYDLTGLDALICACIKAHPARKQFKIQYGISAQ